MRISPTARGGLRLDLEDATDWLMLACLGQDALACDEPLAERLGRLVTDPDAAGDWREFIQPDLETGFQGDLAQVLAAVASARDDSVDEVGSLRIPSDEALRWYSALNQARLALEERYRFGPGDQVDLSALGDEARGAFIRSQFYCAFQSLLLGHAMGG